MKTTSFTHKDEGNVKQNLPVLIVARADRMRDSLETLLQLMPRLRVVGQADTSPSVLGMIMEYDPALVILNTNLPHDQAWTVLRLVKTERPQTQCLVLTDTTQQQQAARLAGADATLIKGFATAELSATIERLLTLEQA